MAFPCRRGGGGFEHWWTLSFFLYGGPSIMGSCPAWLWVPTLLSIPYCSLGCHRELLCSEKRPPRLDGGQGKASLGAGQVTWRLSVCPHTPNRLSPPKSPRTQVVKDCPTTQHLSNSEGSNFLFLLSTARSQLLIRASHQPEVTRVTTLAGCNFNQ